MRLVGWVLDDGDEYHDFQYASTLERRKMERGERPAWRERHTPVYDILSDVAPDDPPLPGVPTLDLLEHSPRWL